MFPWKGPESKLGPGSLFYSPKSLYSSTFPNLGGRACSTEHFWLVKYLQHFTSVIIFNNLQSQSFLVLNSLYHDASTCSYRKKLMTDGQRSSLYSPMQKLVKMVIGFSYISEPICLIFRGLDHGGNTNHSGLKQICCCLKHYFLGVKG